MNKELRKIIDKFPEEIKDLLYESIFHKSILDSNFSSFVLLVFIEHLAFILAYNKFRLIGGDVIPQAGVPGSLFTMSFLPSGAGKDSVVGLIQKKIFRKEIQKILEEQEKYLEIQRAKIEAEGLQRFPDDKENTQRQLYIERLSEKILRRPQLMSAHSTMEGLHADRKIYQQWGKGASFFFVHEIGSYYSRYTDIRQAMDSYLLESSETGNTLGKSIKSDKSINEINNVPVSVHMHGSIINEDVPKALSEFLAWGGARRVIFFYNSKRKKNKDFKDFQNFQDFFNIKKAEGKPKFKSLRTYIAKIANNDHKKIKINDETHLHYKYNQYQYLKKYPENPHYLDIPWRALRLSLSLQMLFNPESKEVDCNTFNISLELIQHYAKFYDGFLSTVQEGLEGKAIEIIKKEKQIGFASLKRKIGAKYIKNNEFFIENILDIAKLKGINIEITTTNRGLSFNYKKS